MASAHASNPNISTADSAPRVAEMAAAASQLLAPDCRGMNFYRIDQSLRDLLDLYMEPKLRAAMEPHLERLGELAGGRLDELAELADKHPPVLHTRDRFGRDEDWVEFHPAYREMERIAFGEFGLHAMAHRPGVLGWPAPLPYIAKYAFQYLFVQAEFGLMCPVSVTDTGAVLLERYGNDDLKRRYLDRMLSQNMDKLLKGAQYMTEKSGGSDLAGSSVTARREGDYWRLYGDKWFCSAVDGDVVLLLARPENAPPGTRGLGLFLMPRRLENGERNSYRVVRLKDKLGTRDMASGEVLLDGAIAYHLGALDRGLRQMMDMVNLSRMSHGARAAGMMRRCLNESMRVARHRVAFGKPVIEYPLMRRQLMKLMVPAEQALSVFTNDATVMDAARAGDAEAERVARILTALLKFRTCRDNLRVATGAMEVRGGNGYIEDWVNSRLIRDGHIGVLWEGTSNINALDVINRAVARARGHETLRRTLRARLDSAASAPARLRNEIAQCVDRAVAFIDEVAAQPKNEKYARLAADALYHVASAALMAWEGSATGAKGGDARRMLLARLVLEHRLRPHDPLAIPPDAEWEDEAIDALLSDAPVPLKDAARLAAA
ncbi:MAG: acyl-CoA dehydrogenase family protein [Candidatus Binataceae bacterium]